MKKLIILLLSSFLTIYCSNNNSDIFIKKQTSSSGSQESYSEEMKNEYYYVGRANIKFNNPHEIWCSDDKAIKIFEGDESNEVDYDQGSWNPAALYKCLFCSKYFDNAMYIKFLTHDKKALVYAVNFFAIAQENVVKYMVEAIENFLKSKNVEKIICEVRSMETDWFWSKYHYSSLKFKSLIDNHFVEDDKVEDTEIISKTSSSSGNNDNFLKYLNTKKYNRLLSSSSSDSKEKKSNR